MSAVWWVRLKFIQWLMIGEVVLVVIAAWYSEQDAAHTTWAVGSERQVWDFCISWKRCSEIGV